MSLNLIAISKHSSSVSYYINILEYRMELLYNNAWNAFLVLTNQVTINLKRSGEFSLPLFLKKMYLFLAVLGLRCCAGFFSSCSEWGLLSGCGAWASHCRGFSWCGAQALGARTSLAVVHRISYSTACGIFLAQGSNWCPSHCKVNS